MALNNFLVLGVNPANNEQDTPINSTVLISFVKHMDTNTLNKETVRLRKVNGDLVDYTFKYNNNSYEMVLTPTSFFDGYTQYQIEIVGGLNGVRTITGDHTTTRTYEFTTVKSKQVTEPLGLSITQLENKIEVKWSNPKDYNENENISFNVRVSSSNNVDSPYIWPEKALGKEYSTEEKMIVVPYEFERNTNYYVYVRAINGASVSVWTQKQIFLEDKKVEEQEKPADVGGPIFKPQLEVVETYPSLHGVISENIVLALSDELDDIYFNASEDELLPVDINDYIYVVKAPYKEVLTAIDMVTKYGKKNMVAGTVQLLEKNIIQWTPSEELEKEQEYVLIINKELKGANTTKLGINFVYGFRSPWNRLYGNINIIKNKLGSFSSNIQDRFIYDSMRLNTLFAYDIVSQTSSFNANEYTETDAPYYVHEYVNIQTAYDNLINSITSFGGGTKEDITLGQLKVVKEFDIAAAIKLLDKLKAELKPWLDLLNGQHGRGYAKPMGAVKGEVGAVYPDYLTRSELKTSFDA